VLDFGAFWRARRQALLTGGAVAAVVAVVAGVAVASGGYTAQRVDLGDAAVWVPNERYESVGRANTAAGELNAVVTNYYGEESLIISNFVARGISG
jgi:hypothetical protein